MIRVLIVDDSATARTLLTSILNADPAIEVVGAAHDGPEAITLTQKLRPDLVMMDLQMPRMNGLEATREIMIRVPTPTVIVTASANLREIKESMDTLRVGALEAVLKPPGPDSPRFADAARQLVNLVKAMSEVKVVRHWRQVCRSGGRPSAAGPAKCAARSAWAPWRSPRPREDRRPCNACSRASPRASRYPFCSSSILPRTSPRGLPPGWIRSAPCPSSWPNMERRSTRARSTSRPAINIWASRREARSNSRRPRRSAGSGPRAPTCSIRSPTPSAPRRWP